MSKRLVVRADVFLALQHEAVAALPLECCGLLAGAAEVIEMILPVRNTADNGETQYEMDPAEMWSARRSATLSGLDVLGFYHSHPRTSPVPSSYDIDRAYYSDAVYLIAGLSPDFTLRAFRITGGRASEIHLEIEPAAR